MAIGKMGLMTLARAPVQDETSAGRAVTLAWRAVDAHVMVVTPDTTLLSVATALGFPMKHEKLSRAIAQDAVELVAGSPVTIYLASRAAFEGVKALLGRS